MLALGLVRAALTDDFARIIVATRDTDLLPAVEMAEDEKPSSVILAAWDGQSALKLGLPLAGVSMGSSEYNKSRDTSDYR
jgi:uncharacterized LabA/DUF88 family protein